MNANRLLVLTSVSFLALTANAAMAGKPNSVSAVPLTVVFDDETPGMMITSDGQGAYSDGELGVSAQFDQYGNLIIDFQTTRTAFRRVKYNYGEPIGTASPPPLETDGTITPSDNYLSTVRRTGEGPLQQLPLNSSQCVQGYLTFTLADANKTQYWNGYQRAPSGIDASETSYMSVTRVDATTWTVQPVAACDSLANGIARLISTPSSGRFSFTDRGLFSMSFKLTLTAK